MVFHLLNPTSEKVLDILVNDLQRRIVELVDHDRPHAKEDYTKAIGIVESIDKVNSIFQKGYETNIEKLIGYYKKAMLKTDPAPLSIAWKDT